MLCFVAFLLFAATGCVEQAAKVIVIPARTGGGGFGCLIAIFIAAFIIDSCNGFFKAKKQDQQLSSSITAPPPKEQYSGYPSTGRYPQSAQPVTKEYFQNKFRFSLKSSDIIDRRIIINFEINTLTDRDYFFLCNKHNISDSVNSTEKPYIVDSKGSKHEMVGSPTGDISKDAFPANESGYNPDRTYRFKLRPAASVTGRMEFPMISEGTRKFSLFIPGVNGWQSEIKFENIQLIDGGPLPIVAESHNISRGENRINPQTTSDGAQRETEQRRQEAAELEKLEFDNQRRKAEEKQIAEEQRRQATVQREQREAEYIKRRTDEQKRAIERRRPREVEYIQRHDSYSKPVNEHSIIFDNYDELQLQSVFELRKSGTENSWVNTKSGIGYTVIPRPAYEEKSFNVIIPCRQAELILTTKNGVVKDKKLNACRQNGKWVFK